MHKRGGAETEVGEVGWRDFTLYMGVDFMLFGWIPQKLAPGLLAAEIGNVFCSLFLRFL